MLVPKLRFKREDGSEYPEWEELSMNEIFMEIIEKNRPDLPVLSILQGQGTVYRDSSDRNILYDKKSTVNYKAMRKGDFIIHLRTFEGGLECATLDGISSPAYKILRTDKLIPEAYKAYFRSKQFIEGRLAVAVTGVRDGKNIEMSTFWQILVPVACLEEQQKIADFLSAYDEVIAQSEAEVQNLEQQKKAAMQKIFSQEVRFKREDGTEYPEWEEKELKMVAKILMGQSPSGSSVNTNKNGFPLVQGKADILGYGIIPDRYTSTPTKVSEPNDIIMTVRAPVGFVSKLGFAACIGRGVCAIRANENEDYIYYVLQNKESEWKYIEQGSTFTAVNSDDVSSLIVPVPCLEEQQKIADFLSAYDEAISYAKQELDKWKELKKGLLQQMFM